MNKRKIKVAVWNGPDKNEKRAKSLMQGLLSVIVDVIVMFIFVWAARIILKEVFKTPAMKMQEIIGCIIVAALMSGVMELIDIMVYKGKALLKCCTLLGGLGIAFLYAWIFKDFDKILGGFTNFSVGFIQKWNAYYKMALKISLVKNGSEGLAVGFAAFLLIIFAMWLGKFTRIRLIFAMIPVIAIALGVIVGYAPSATGCVIMLVGILLANVSEFDRPEFALSVRDRVRGLLGMKCAYVALVAVGIIIGSMGVRGMVTSSVKDSLKYSSAVKDIQKNILENFSISEILKIISENIWNKDKGGEIISNMPLAFDDKIVLKLHTDKKSIDAIYLKGFYGSEYRNGRWIYDGEDFERALKKKDYDEQLVQEGIAFAGTDAIMNYSGKQYIYEFDKLEAKLEYLKTGDTTAYIPYFTHGFSSITIRGDVCFKKAKKRKSIEYTIFQDELDYLRAYDYFPYNGEESWKNWYEKYVCDTYLYVPEYMENIKEVASELREQDLQDIKGEPDENLLRVRAADVVVEWFAENMTYTQSPPSLPRKADPIEYFVGESKEGYCMHYASAATLILRQLGVPARYASGYYVSTADFEEMADGYTAYIMDNAAHAWVEIYLDEIGWVPIEVTTSYSDGVNPNRDYSDVDVEVETPGETPSQEENNDKESSSEPTTTASDKESTTKPKETVSEPTTTSGVGYYGTNNEALKKNTWAKVLAISLIAIIIPAVILYIIKASKRKEEKLRIMIENKKSRRAIKEINRRIYVKLKKKGKLIGMKSSDMAYKEVLVKTYPLVSKEEWDKYMDIVREMAFSKNEGTVEDMEYCYEIYMRVKK